MEKRAFIAVGLSLIILIVYQYFFMKPQMKSPPPTEPTRERVAERERESDIPLADIKKETPLAEDRSISEEKLVRIETPLYIVTFSSVGGTIKQLHLKEFKDKDGENIALIGDDTKVPALSIGETQDLSLGYAHFSTTSDDTTLGHDETSKVVFEFSSSGVRVRRTYTLYGDYYKIELRDKVDGLKDYLITLGSDFGMTGETGYGSHIGPVLLDDLDREEFNPDKKLDAPKRFGKNVKWIAQEDKYFFSSIVPLSGIDEALVWKTDKTMLIALRTDSQVSDFLIFAGPKKHDILKPLNVGLENIIDFGFFSIIARPIFWILEFFNRFIGNYGWSIIFLTIALRVPFIPLINKGQSSMKKMQKIQPLMNEVREKYKKDPQRMQKEMMVLYKKNKVNPMGGCLPILIQLPVFFALYKVLLVAIELRGAPFMLWITDLSAKDPFYILPIVMGGTMFLQQKMTPTGMDPRQAKIMMFMPLIFTFMFLNFPSGLVLYWLVSNLLSIAQQWHVNKKASP